MPLGIVGGLVVNAIVGLLILYLVDALDLMDIDIDVISVVITAIFGVLGAAIVIVLTLVDIL